jgi:hypothetical protein
LCRCKRGGIGRAPRETVAAAGSGSYVLRCAGGTPAAGESVEACVRRMSQINAKTVRRERAIKPVKEVCGMTAARFECEA